jgi:hypothetical protein
MADDGAGATLTFGTSGTTLNKVSVQSQGYAREALETTHLATTGGYKTYIPADFKEPGTVSLSWLYDPDVQPPIEAATETITITHPVPTGAVAGATEVFSGFVTDWDPPELANDTVMTATLTIKKTGIPTFTDATLST